MVPSLTTTVADWVEMTRSPPSGTAAAEAPPGSPDRSTLTVSLLDLMEMGNSGDSFTAFSGSGFCKDMTPASEWDGAMASDGLADAWGAYRGAAESDIAAASDGAADAAVINGA